MDHFFARCANVQRRVTAAVCCLFFIFLSAGSAVPTTKEEERQRNEEAALAIWPEAADPQSVMGREMRRLLDLYTARKDPRLDLVTSPMWIASQAAANTEQKRADGESQQSAMRLYPDLAVLDSPLNRLFRDTYSRYKEVKPDYFTDPRWPIKLAQQCSLQLEAQRAIGSTPTRAPGKLPGGPLSQSGMEVDGSVEVLPHPARKWVVTGSLLVLGLALSIGILIRANRSRLKKDLSEQNGSSI
jgi:hypothetical protein